MRWENRVLREEREILYACSLRKPGRRRRGVPS